MATINVNTQLVDIDIVDAISYFGINELLDAIGFEAIERYLAELKAQEGADEGRIQSDTASIA